MSETTPTTPPPPQAGGLDLVAEFKKMPTAEKMLACASVAALLGFIVLGAWSALFKLGFGAQVWLFPTFAFLGSLATILLFVTKLFGLRIMDPALFTKVLVGAGVLPVVGFVISTLINFWSGLMLAACIAMAYAAAKITTRENIIRLK